MSKIGQQSIILPQGTKLEVQNNHVRVSGPKGVLERTIPRGFKLEIKEQEARLLPPKNLSTHTRALWGTWRSLIQNMVQGVTTGFKKELEYKGVGYKAETDGKTLNLALGFSHPLKVEAPDNIEFSVEKNIITIQGIDKEQVGQIAAKIRKFRPPEPYKGKGVKYKDEIIRRKEGKKSVSAGF